MTAALTVCQPKFMHRIDRVTFHPGQSAACPHLSPRCPHAIEPKKPNEINVSPVSPRVPSFLKQDAANDDFEHEALKKRAAIMEFDGGMTRADAEAAACARLGLAA
jgi:hypothetical protein